MRTGLGTKRVDDSTKQALLSWFSAYLDRPDDAPDPSDDRGELADQYSILVEVAGLRSEVRTESRLVKDALDQFRGVFETLQANQTTLQRELDRARADMRDQAEATLRPLLLDIIDLRDRLTAALALSAALRPRWQDRLLGRHASGREAWHDGLRMTLRRFDQVLSDRHVTIVPLLGEPFDPGLARVIGTSPDASVAEGVVIEEVRSGFLWNDQVLRTAEVIVSKSDAGEGKGQ